MRTLIFGGVVVNEGMATRADLIINDDRIESLQPDGSSPRGIYDSVVDASGCVVMPGVIDTHVHFREPGMTHKADIASESRAAAWGGVTTYFEMPNTKPQTTTLSALGEKRAIAAATSRVNYAFLFGATNDNAGLFTALDSGVPAIKLFMGSSTGNMLVDDEAALDRVFQSAADCGLLIVAHCEDTAIISRNMAAAKARHGDDPDVSLHSAIRSREACLASSRKAVELARKHGTRLHIAHISTAEELDLLNPVEREASASRFKLHRITGEATVAHLLFCDEDYARLGSRIKCNPAIKTSADRSALRRALSDGRITTIATDHAPHLLDEKQGGAARAMSGMPMLQFSLPAMLTLADEGIITLPRLAELMCHAPARLFGVRERGFLRPGYKADIAIVRRATWTVRAADVQSKCRWSPLEGITLGWRVEHTFCNGRHILEGNRFDDEARGEAVTFNH